MAIRRSGRILAHDDDDLEEGNLLQRLLGRLGLLRDWQTAVSIRRIYRKMLRAADASGYPRLDTETPYEFLKTLPKRGQTIDKKPSSSPQPTSRFGTVNCPKPTRRLKPSNLPGVPGTNPTSRTD